MTEKIIEIRNATVYRGSAKVFENLSLEIIKGNNTAIIGPNGAGKTT
ncbi:MAG: ATP-binding cassette domain-containing protein, partial [Acidiferrobacterales bacterium]